MRTVLSMILVLATIACSLESASCCSFESSESGATSSEVSDHHFKSKTDGGTSESSESPMHVGCNHGHCHHVLVSESAFSLKGLESILSFQRPDAYSSVDLKASTRPPIA